MMDKREDIERALKSTIGKACLEAGFDSGTLAGILTVAREILAEQAIVIECEVEHGHHIGSPKTFLFTSEDVPPYWALNACGSGHHGTPGKALAIILPRKE